MKGMLLLFVFGLAILICSIAISFLSACVGDDNNVPPVNDSFYGYWFYTDYIGVCD